MSNIADPAMLVALMLIAAILGGYAAVLVRVPRVVGYLVAGVALHYALAAAFQPSDNAAGQHTLLGAIRDIQGIKRLALGLIMFAIGSVFETSHLKAVGRRVFRISLVKIVAVFMLVGVGCTFVAYAAQGFPSSQAFAFGLLLAAAAIATAPAATLLVLREYEAKGPMADTLLTLTAINNVICIVLFHALFLILSSFDVIETTYGAGRWLWLDLMLTSVGSVALGVVAGFLFSILHAKLTTSEFLLIFLGVVLALGAYSQLLAEQFHLSFNFLLVCLFLGATFANTTTDPDAFQKALHALSTPLYAVFFVIAGFELHLADLQHIGLLGLAYVVLRTFAKFVGGWVGVRWADARGELRDHLGLGMLCQAGVAIGLADFVYRAWGTNQAGGYTVSEPALAFQTIILGSVVIFELIGPLALKAVVVRSGEVKAVTLLRRHRAAASTRESTLQLTWNALLRMVGMRPRSRVGAIQESGLRVRHIMRSSIKAIPSSATLDDVLHFIETSRFNHFPVVDDAGQYTGMIHFSDVRQIMYDPMFRELVTANDIARQNTPHATTANSLDELFDLFRESDVGCMAVLDNEQSAHVVGIVEQRDLLTALRAGHKAAKPRVS